jgi:hypothetical protein
MGYTSNPAMLYNFSQLVQPRDDLEHLSAPFSTSDIDKVIKQMPVDKALGPDGFNGLFLKSSWEIIKEDVYTLCFDFFNGSLNPEAINSSFITLVPKVNNPTTVGAHFSFELYPQAHHKAHDWLSASQDNSPDSHKSVRLHQDQNNPRLSCLGI